jgi:hypothetical protein
MKTAEGATDPTDDPGDTTVAGRRGRGKPLSNGERTQILHSLLQRWAGGKLHRGAVATVAVEFRVSRHCVGAIWKRGQDGLNNGGQYLDVSHKRAIVVERRSITLNRFRI